MNKAKVILGFLFLICMMVLIGCKEEETADETQAQPLIEIDGRVDLSNTVIVEDKHTRSDEYSRPFDVMLYEDGYLSVGFLKDLYLEDELMLKVDEIKWDYEVLNQELGAIPEGYTIYIVDETIAGGTYIVGDKIYCSQADFESGDYRVALVQGVMNTPDKWLAVGVAGAIFGADIDEALLKSYYESVSNLSMLCLCNPRFHNEYNTPEELEIAKMTSVSLITYLIDNIDKRVIKDQVEVSNIIKTEWLASIGVDRTFVDPYEHVLDGFTFQDHDSYDFWAVSDEEEYYIDLTASMHDSSEWIEKVIYQTYMNRRYLIDAFASFGEDHMDSSSIPFVTYTISSNAQGELINGNNIITRNGMYLTKLIIDDLIGDIDRSEWKPSLLDEYYVTLMLPSKYDLFATTYYEVIYNEDAGLFISNYDLMMDYMETLGLKSDDPSSFSTRMLIDAFAYLDYFVEDASNIGTYYQLSSSSSANRTPGDDLSINGFISFNAYLIDMYSLEIYLDYIAKDISFQEAFGMDYETVRTDWLSYIDISSP